MIGHHMSPTPALAIIVPAHRGGSILQACLTAVASQTQAPAEFVVVADGPKAGADPELSEAVRAAGARLVVQPFQGGPAAARNTGVASTTSPVLFFVDSDVVLASNACERAWAGVGAREATADAVFGSYDESPGDPGFISQYKNLVHHLVHQRAATRAHSFWGACGVVRRSAFAAVGGFDESYARPCIEDIELGYRLGSAGYRVHIDPLLQVTHLKEWTAKGLLHTDLLDRAVPWTKLILRSRTLLDDLGTEPVARAQLVLTAAGAAALASTPRFGRWALLGAVASLASAVALDAPLLRGLARLRGVGFAARSVPWRLAHYGVSIAGLIMGTTSVAAERAGLRQPPRARLRPTEDLAASAPASQGTRG